MTRYRIEADLPAVLSAQEATRLLIKVTALVEDELIELLGAPLVSACVRDEARLVEVTE